MSNPVPGKDNYLIGGVKRIFQQSMKGLTKITGNDSSKTAKGTESKARLTKLSKGVPIISKKEMSCRSNSLNAGDTLRLEASLFTRKPLYHGKSPSRGTGEPVDQFHGKPAWTKDSHQAHENNTNSQYVPASSRQGQKKPSPKCPSSGNSETKRSGQGNGKRRCSGPSPRQSSSATKTGSSSDLSVSQTSPSNHQGSLNDGVKESVGKYVLDNIKVDKSSMMTTNSMSPAGEDWTSELLAEASETASISDNVTVENNQKSSLSETKTDSGLVNSSSTFQRRRDGETICTTQNCKLVRQSASLYSRPSNALDTGTIVESRTELVDWKGESKEKFKAKTNVEIGKLETDVIPGFDFSKSSKAPSKDRTTQESHAVFRHIGISENEKNIKSGGDYLDQKENYTSENHRSSEKCFEKQSGPIFDCAGSDKNTDSQRIEDKVSPSNLVPVVEKSQLVKSADPRTQKEHADRLPADEHEDSYLNKTPWERAVDKRSNKLPSPVSNREYSENKISISRRSVTSIPENHQDHCSKTTTFRQEETSEISCTSKLPVDFSKVRDYSCNPVPQCQPSLQPFGFSQPNKEVLSNHRYSRKSRARSGVQRPAAPMTNRHFVGEDWTDELDQMDNMSVKSSSQIIGNDSAGACDVKMQNDYLIQKKEIERIGTPENTKLGVKTDKLGDKSSCQSVPVVNTCQSRPVVNTCQSRPAVNTCQSRPVVNTCQSVPVVNTCQSVPVVNTCQSRPVVNTCQSRPVVNTCQSVPVVNTCQSVSVVNSCQSVSVVNTCQSRPVVNTCQSVPVVNTCQSRPVVNTCQSVSVVNTCQSVSVVNSCQSVPVVSPFQSVRVNSYGNSVYFGSQGQTVNSNNLRLHGYYLLGLSALKESEAKANNQRKEIETRNSARNEYDKNAVSCEGDDVRQQGKPISSNHQPEYKKDKTNREDEESSVSSGHEDGKDLSDTESDSDSDCFYRGYRRRSDSSCESEILTPFERHSEGESLPDKDVLIASSSTSYTSCYSPDPCSVPSRESNISSDRSEYYGRRRRSDHSSIDEEDSSDCSESPRESYIREGERRTSNKPGTSARHMKKRSNTKDKPEEIVDEKVKKFIKTAFQLSAFQVPYEMQLKEQQLSGSCEPVTKNDLVLLKNDTVQQPFSNICKQSEVGLNQQLKNDTCKQQQTISMSHTFGIDNHRQANIETAKHSNLDTQKQSTETKTLSNFDSSQQPTITTQQQRVDTSWSGSNGSNKHSCNKNGKANNEIKPPLFDTTKQPTTEANQKVGVEKQQLPLHAGRQSTINMNQPSGFQKNTALGKGDFSTALKQEPVRRLGPCQEDEILERCRGRSKPGSRIVNKRNATIPRKHSFSSAQNSTSVLPSLMNLVIPTPVKFKMDCKTLERSGQSSSQGSGDVPKWSSGEDMEPVNELSSVEWNPYSNVNHADGDSHRSTGHYFHSGQPFTENWEQDYTGLQGMDVGDSGAQQDLGGTFEIVGHSVELDSSSVMGIPVDSLTDGNGSIDIQNSTDSHGCAYYTQDEMDSLHQDMPQQPEHVGPVHIECSDKGTTYYYNSHDDYSSMEYPQMMEHYWQHPCSWSANQSQNAQLEAYRMHNYQTYGATQMQYMPRYAQAPSYMGLYPRFPGPPNYNIPVPDPNDPSLRRDSRMSEYWTERLPHWVQEQRLKVTPDENNSIIPPTSDHTVPPFPPFAPSGHEGQGQFCTEHGYPYPPYPQYPIPQCPPYPPHFPYYPPHAQPPLLVPHPMQHLYGPGGPVSELSLADVNRNFNACRPEPDQSKVGDDSQEPQITLANKPAQKLSDSPKDEESNRDDKSDQPKKKQTRGSSVCSCDKNEVHFWIWRACKCSAGLWSHQSLVPVYLEERSFDNGYQSLESFGEHDEAITSLTPDTTPGQDVSDARSATNSHTQRCLRDPIEPSCLHATATHLARARRELDQAEISEYRLNTVLRNINHVMVKEREILAPTVGKPIKRQDKMNNFRQGYDEGSPLQQRCNGSIEQEFRRESKEAGMTDSSDDEPIPSHSFMVDYPKENVNKQVDGHKVSAPMSGLCQSDVSNRRKGDSRAKTLADSTSDRIVGPDKSFIDGYGYYPNPYDIKSTRGVFGPRSQKEQGNGIYRGPPGPAPKTRGPPFPSDVVSPPDFPGRWTRWNDNHTSPCHVSPVSHATPRQTWFMGSSTFRPAPAQMIGPQLPAHLSLNRGNGDKFNGETPEGHWRKQSENVALPDKGTAKADIFNPPIATKVTPSKLVSYDISEDDDSSETSEKDFRSSRKRFKSTNSEECLNDHKDLSFTENTNGCFVSPLKPKNDTCSSGKVIMKRNKMKLSQKSLKSYSDVTSKPREVVTRSPSFRPSSFVEAVARTRSGSVDYSPSEPQIGDFMKDEDASSIEIDIKPASQEFDNDGPDTPLPPLPLLPQFPVSPFWAMYSSTNNSALTHTSDKAKQTSPAQSPAITQSSWSTVHTPDSYTRAVTPKQQSGERDLVSPTSWRSKTRFSPVDVTNRSPTMRQDWRKHFKTSHNFGVKYVDTHCHLDFLFNRMGYRGGSLEKFMADYPDTFPETFEGCVAVFCNPSSFALRGLWLDVARENNVWIAMGCHPKNATDFTDFSHHGLLKCLQHNKMVAVGEIGLDYSGTFHQHAAVQKKVFRLHIEIALQLNKPLVIHCRDAEEDCLEILKEMVPSHYTIHCHCFTGWYANAQLWMNAFPNLFIGLTPLVTFPSAKPCHDLARNIPLERLLLETDAPYFIPRGIPKEDLQFSNPGLAVTVAKEVARYKGIETSTVLMQCRLNTKKMYNI